MILGYISSLVNQRFKFWHYQKGIRQTKQNTVWSSYASKCEKKAQWAHNQVSQFQLKGTNSSFWSSNVHLNRAAFYTIVACMKCELQNRWTTDLLERIQTKDDQCLETVLYFLAKTLQIRNVLHKVGLFLWLFSSDIMWFCIFCDSVTKFGHAVTQLSLAWSIWEKLSMCGI